MNIVAFGVGDLVGFEPYFYKFDAAGLRNLSTSADRQLMSRCETLLDIQPHKRSEKPDKSIILTTSRSRIQSKKY